MENICFNEFCRNQKCPEYIKWDFGMGDCESCKLVGQSYNINEYPQDCLFISKIKEYEREKLSNYDNYFTNKNRLQKVQIG